MLSDWVRRHRLGVLLAVSMHLLVLSAFRHAGGVDLAAQLGLNAPFGAQCFPTGRRPRRLRRRSFSLNAPFGAQCFPTVWAGPGSAGDGRVSMHLLVLSAFRLERPFYV